MLEQSKNEKSKKNNIFRDKAVTKFEYINNLNEKLIKENDSNYFDI